METTEKKLAMAGDKAYLGSSKTIVLLPNDSLSPSRDSLWPPCSPCAPTLRGANSACGFENAKGEEASDIPLAQAIVKGESEHEELDISLTQPTKKRRLTSKQIQFLESNFALENKLEPERKFRLAKELGLQSRQVAIWFQNRRARFKNKQLEKDYDSLKVSYEKLKADYESLVKEKESLEYEVSSLKGKLADREKGMELESLEPLDSLESYPQSTPRAVVVGESACNMPGVITPKQEDASSAKSDVFDSDSPLSLLEPDQSEFSQDEEDQPCRASFLSSPSLPKLCHDPSDNSCNYDFPVEDQPFWTCTYGGLYY